MSFLWEVKLQSLNYLHHGKWSLGMNLFSALLQTWTLCLAACNMWILVFTNCLHAYIWLSHPPPSTQKKKSLPPSFLNWSLAKKMSSGIRAERITTRLRLLYYFYKLSSFTMLSIAIYSNYQLLIIRFNISLQATLNYHDHLKINNN